MSSWKKIAQRIRVPAGTVMGILFLVLMHPSARSLWIGAIIAVPGSLLRLWAAGHIEKGTVLTQGGPYAYTRNPLYLGSFLMAFGIIIAGQGYWLLPVFAGFYALFYIPVMKAEEEYLSGKYGSEFARYANTVPLFLPSFRNEGGNSSAFLWSRVLRNREHRNIAGLMVAVAILLLKYLFG